MVSAVQHITGGRGSMALTFILAACTTLWCACVHAELRAALSSDEIDELDSVQLVVRDLGTRQSETPDLSPLDDDFHVLGVNTSSQYRFVNGRAQSWVDYQITLQPKRTGELLIPPFRIGQQQTEAMRLSVRELSEAMRRKVGTLVFYELELSSESVYVQSQLLLTRRLVYADGVQLFGGQLEKPELPGAQVVELGEGKSSVVQRDGRSYGSFEQRYAIFPEQSGVLTIPSDSVTASVRVLDGISTSRKTVRVSTDEKRITVKPIPSEYPADKPWLPAIAVTAAQRFEPPLISDFEVGDTVTRTVNVRVIGNSGASLPPLQLALPEDHFKTYPQPTEISDDTMGDNLVGMRVETQDIVPIVAGALGLPSTEIIWWNTDTESLMTTTLNRRALSAVGNAIAATVLTEPAAATIPRADAPQLGGTVKADNSLLNLGRAAIALMILWVLAAIWRRRSPPSQNERKLAERASAGSTANTESPSAPTLKALQQSVKNAAPLSVRHDMALYLRNILGLSRGPALEAFRRSSETARSALEGLDAACYGDGMFTSEHRAQTLDALKHFSHTQKHAAKTKSPALPSLYAS